MRKVKLSTGEQVELTEEQYTEAQNLAHESYSTGFNIKQLIECCEAIYNKYNKKTEQENGNE
ncbi:MAG: hypothetical protein LBV41_08555 [Cytophagaceae bacterium]|jgi:hypothetical protein|nr:hypothetical protein [Cytophagaceae bacterium]